VSSSSKAKAISRTTRSTRLYHPDEASVVVGDHRLFFLSAIRRTPEAHARFAALGTTDTVALAARDFRQLKKPSPELERRIEQWATGIHLARAPVKNWWIFEVATDWLRGLAAGPPDRSLFPIDDDDDGPMIDYYALYEWDSYCSLRVALPSSPQKELKFHPYDPTVWTRGDYLKYARHTFERFLESHMREQLDRYEEMGHTPVPGPRDDKQYEALVKYQMLGCGFPEIAGYSPEMLKKDDDLAKEVESLRVTVIQLHKLIVLPQGRTVGRPRTKL
jgi:hypothetical protein